MSSNLFKQSDNCTITLEAVQYQDGKAFDALTDGCKRLREGGFTNQAIVDSELESLIMIYTGINVRIGVDEGWANAVVITPNIDSNHPFDIIYEKNMMSSASGLLAVSLLGEKARGSVNPKTGKIGGIFSKFPIPLLIGTGLPRVGITDRELAAIILHELGHIYTYFYYLGNLVSANIIIANAAMATMADVSLEEKVKVLNKASEYLGIDVANPDQLATQPEVNRVKNIELIYINAHRNHVASLTGTDIYDLRNCEQMADNYATMFGAGSALVTGQDKLNKLYGDRGTLSTSMNMALDIIDIFSAISSFSISAVIGTSPAVKIYDSSKDRIRLIRDTLVKVLKDKDLPKPLFQKLDKELREINAVIERISDYEGVLMFFWKKFTKIGKATTSVEESQKALERLLLNDLYYKSAQLRNM